MTITNSRNLSYQEIKTKTELEIINECKINCTRLINSKIYTFLIENEKPITVKYIANLTKVDDELFISFAQFDEVFFKK